MTRIQQVRTTAFRLSPSAFGEVYVYRPSERFAAIWKGLEDRWRQERDHSEFKRLPYRGLTTALRVLSGDFVALERWAGSGNAFIISRKLISREDLQNAIHAWELSALELPGDPVSSLVGELQMEKLSVSDCITYRPGLCPNLTEGWVWDIAVWESAHRLAQSAMRTDKGDIRWRLDSDAALLSWDHPVIGASESKASALHKLTLHLITIPGIEEPVLSVQASLVRLAPSWKVTGGARYAWAELSDSVPLLRGRVRNKRVGDGYVTDWHDRAVDVLHAASINPLPRISGDPDPTGPVRTGYAKQPRTHALGRGVGPWFHEYVAHHMHRSLASCAMPVDLEIHTGRSPRGMKSKSGRRPLHQDLPDSPKTKAELGIIVVYADSAMRLRLRKAIEHLLCQDAHVDDAALLQKLSAQLKSLDDGTVLRVGPLELCFLMPPEAEDFLLKRQPQAEIVAWAKRWLPVDLPEKLRLAVILETDTEVSDGPKVNDKLADPKQVLRRYFASQGVVSQFITASSAPKKRTDKTDKFQEHAAANAMSDLLRSAGFFLRPFPALDHVEGTVVVGVYGTRWSQRTTQTRRASYVVNLVAVSLGSTEAWGYVDNEGWLPIHAATTHFLASDSHRSLEEAKALVERAVDALGGRFKERRVVLLFDAFGCRRFWPCLTDKSDGKPEAWMVKGGKAVVRVRTAVSEIVRAAGVGQWSEPPSPARHAPFRLMRVKESEGQSPSYVFTGSNLMSRERSAREGTRFAAKPASLKKDWHSLGVTELQLLDAGSWKADELLQQLGLLCRYAPMWKDRTLRWPSPLHLARAIVRDHPHGYFNESEDAKEPEDSKPMRLDHGINS